MPRFDKHSANILLYGEEGKMDKEMLQQVKELKEKGVKRKDIAKQLNVGIWIIDRAFAELRKMAAQESPPPQGVSEDRLREIIHEELEGRDAAGNSRLPAVLKTGKGQEVISPEGIMQQYLMGDGNHGAAIFQGMMMLRAAQLMVLSDVEIIKGQAEAQAIAIKPILDIMEKAREDMDSAAERARQSTEEVALAAAGGAAARAAVHIDERFDQMAKQKADIATVEDPFKGLMARTLEGALERIPGMMSGQQPGATPGLVDKRNRGGE